MEIWMILINSGDENVKHKIKRLKVQIYNTVNNQYDVIRNIYFTKSQ